MTTAWTGILSMIGLVSISAALVVLGLLSRRLGQVTHASPRYIGFFIAAALVGAGALARLLHLQVHIHTLTTLHHNIIWVLLYNGLPACGVTLGVIVAWRYWSWLLAERD